MTAFTIERVGLIALVAGLGACSGGKQATTEGGVTSGPKWSVTATFQPGGTPNPDVVLWSSQAQAELFNPVVDGGVPSWSASGTVTVTRWPSRQGMGNECTASVSPNSQVITLNEANTRVVLRLDDGDPEYEGMATTRFNNQRTVTCPNQPDNVVSVDDGIDWLVIPTTVRPSNPAVIQGMSNAGGNNYTWTLTKSGQ